MGVSGMAQWVKDMLYKSIDLSLIPTSHCGTRKPTPKSCPLTSINMPTLAHIDQTLLITKMSKYYMLFMKFAKLLDFKCSCLTHTHAYTHTFVCASAS